MVHPKDTTVGTVYLDVAAEARLLVQVRRRGGYALATATTDEAVNEALELVARTLTVLEHGGAAELPPIIHDCVPRDLSR